MNTVIHILCLEWSGWLADISLPPIAGSEVRWYIWTCHFCCTLDCWSLISIYAFSILQYQLELVGTWLWWQVKQIPRVGGMYVGAYKKNPANHVRWVKSSEESSFFWRRKFSSDKSKGIIPKPQVFFLLYNRNMTSSPNRISWSWQLPDHSLFLRAMDFQQ